MSLKVIALILKAVGGMALTAGSIVSAVNISNKIEAGAVPAVNKVKETLNENKANSNEEKCNK